MTPTAAHTCAMMDVRTWVERQRASHAREDEKEAQRLAALSPEERAALLASLCASGFRVLDALPPDERRKALSWRDPLPADSVAALSRLRQAYRRRGGGR